MSKLEQELQKSLVIADRQAREPLTVYRPTEVQESFHRSSAAYRLIRGGNRSGKSTSAALEFAAMILGLAIIGRDGKPIRRRRPLPDRAVAWVIGFDQRHIAQTIYRLLFEPGQFKLLPKGTGYELYNPNKPEHAAREAEVVLSEAAIPARYVVKTTFEDVGKKVINSCELEIPVLDERGHLIKTRHVIVYFLPSTQRQAKQGDNVHLLWVDEDIEYPQHIAEYRMRLAACNGEFIWSATPQMKHDELLKLCYEAEQDEGKDDPDFALFVMRYRDNPTVSEKDKSIHLRGFSEDEIRARDFGEFTFDSIQVYPQFSQYIHGCPSAEADDDPLNIYIRQFGTLPDDWCRFFVLDPGGGGGVNAGLFAAVPPPGSEFGDIVVIEDELYLRHATADMVAETAKHKMRHWQYQTFLIDSHAAKATGYGRGEDALAFYSQAFDKHGLRSAETGCTFAAGHDKQHNREIATRVWLAPTHGEWRPKVRYLVDRVMHLPIEMRGLRVRPNGERVKSADHAADCLEYLAAHGCAYVPPKFGGGRPKTAYERFKESQRSFQGSRGVMLGVAS